MEIKVLVGVSGLPENRCAQRTIRCTANLNIKEGEAVTSLKFNCKLDTPLNPVDVL